MVERDFNLKKESCTAPTKGPGGTKKGKVIPGEGRPSFVEDSQGGNSLP